MGVMLASLVFSPNTWARNVFYGQLDLYSLEVPLGWTVEDAGDVADANIASPGGKERGSMFVGVHEAKGTLDDEANEVVTNPLSQQPITVDGFSCLHVTYYSRGPGNTVFCQFTVPFEDGPTRVTFWIGNVAHPDEQTSQETAFWQTVHSIKWSEGLEP